MIITIFELICLLLSLQALAYILLDIWTKYWPTIPVETLAVDTHSLTSQVRSGVTVFTIRARYSYVIRGATFISNRIGIIKNVRTDNINHYEQYKRKVEASKIARYCPFYPSYSILLTGQINKTFTYFTLLLGIGLIALIRLFSLG